MGSEFRLQLPKLKKSGVKTVQYTLKAAPLQEFFRQATALFVGHIRFAADGNAGYLRISGGLGLPATLSSKDV